MRWVPKKVEDEWEKLAALAFEIVSDEDEEGAFGRALQEVTEKYGNPEVKAFNAYCDRLGDENQLRDKDRSYIENQDGHWIQEWGNSEDGFVRDKNGNRVYYRDGTPVPNVEWPEIIQRLHDEEYGPDGDNE